MRIVAALIAFAAMVGAPAADAAQMRRPWDRVGEWEILTPDRGVCAASREYPSRTVIYLVISSNRHRRLSVTNPGWPEVAPGPYRIRLVVGGTPTAITAAREGAVYNGGRTIWVGPNFPAQFAAATAIEIHRPDGGPAERLELGAVAGAIDRLVSCVAKSARSRTAARPSPSGLPAAGQGKSKPTRARANVAAYFSSDDYPAAALQARQEGEVNYRLEVDSNGRVSSCTITSSSGSASLDSTTCALLVRRVQFEPARDAEGRPVGDTVNGSMGWRLPPSRRRSSRR